MSEDNIEKQKSQESILEPSKIRSQDALDARNSSGVHIKAIRNLDPNRSDGSAGGENKDDSIRIESDGKVIAARVLPQDSITRDELKDFANRARGGYPWAQDVLTKLEAADRLPSGAERDEAVAKAQDMADLMARRGPYALNSNSLYQTRGFSADSAQLNEQGSATADYKISDSYVLELGAAVSRATSSDEADLIQAQFSIEYMTKKGEVALESLRKPLNERDLIASNLSPTVPNFEVKDVSELRLDATNPTTTDGTVSQNLGWTIDYVLQRAHQKSVEESHKKYDGRDAENNDEFLEMFLAGSGNDRQVHSESSDKMLQAFIKSPGAVKIRNQYLSENCPAFTKDLGYGTFQAYQETLLPKLNGLGIQVPDYSSPGVHVGGFGKPPKEQADCACTATRCDSGGKPAKNGNYVQFQVVNVAGEHSWFLHLPFVKDKPHGQKGERRTITEIFKWIEPIPRKEGKK